MGNNCYWGFSDKDGSKLSITLGVNVFIRLFQIVNVLQKQAFKVVKSYRLNDHNEADFMNLILKNFHRWHIISFDVYLKITSKGYSKDGHL